MSKQDKIIIAIATLVIILITIFAVVKSAGGVGGAKDDNLFEGQMSLEKLANISSCPLTADKDAFAKCLTDKGFVMYGAAWCTHCKEQKELFGDSFKYIKYVECPENTELCLAKNVQGYPTWIRGVQK